MPNFFDGDGLICLLSTNLIDDGLNKRPMRSHLDAKIGDECLHGQDFLRDGEEILCL